MANTLIQIKRSSVTSLPSSLSPAEPAYSYVANTLFMGTADGAGVIPIGGYSYVNKINAAFDFSNTVSIATTAAFAKANSANYYAYLVDANTTAAFEKANTANYFAYLVNANTTAAFDKANNANYFAYLVNANTTAAYNQANIATDIAVAAYANSNTKLALSGGTITGDLSVVGTLYLSGNTTFANVNTLVISDPLLYLAANNYVSDIVDIGFVANYVNTNGQNVHTGFYREHTNKEYYIFQEYAAEPENNHIDPTGNNFTLAVLNADIRTSNLNLGGTNAISWITSSFAKANSANYFAYLVNANTVAAFDKANTANYFAYLVDANTTAAFNKANTANYFAYLVNANSVAAYDHANSAYVTAYNAYDMANTANVNAANASYLSVGTVPSGRISGPYTGITGVGTILAGTWNADVITVPYGGTGGTSFTQNGILYGNTAGPLKVTSAGTEGQVLQADSSGVPQFAHLDGGSF